MGARLPKVGEPETSQGSDGLLAMHIPWHPHDSASRGSSLK
jgi:hypothetical protein